MCQRIRIPYLLGCKGELTVPDVPLAALPSVGQPARTLQHSSRLQACPPGHDSTILHPELSQKFAVLQHNKLHYRADVSGVTIARGNHTRWWGCQVMWSSFQYRVVIIHTRTPRVLGILELVGLTRCRGMDSRYATPSSQREMTSWRPFSSCSA
jgi:hypothetical protein